MTTTTGFLFIGGPQDGRRIALRGEPPVAVVPDTTGKLIAATREAPPTVEIKQTAYRRERIGFPGDHVVMYVADGLTVAEAVRKLIDGYYSTATGRRR